MISDADVKKLRKTFITKKDLKVALDKYATKDDLRLNTEYIVSAMTEMTDSVIARIDKVLDRTETNEDELQDHESRLRKVENKVFIL